MSRIHRIALQVDDIGPIVDWYRQQQDCKVDYVDTNCALIRFENVCLALVKAGQHPQPFLGLGGIVGPGTN